MTTKKIVPTFGYNHLEPSAPGNTKMYRICGAHTRNEATVNELCQRPAGWGTSHSGAGRCKLHGGSAPMRENKYSALWRGRMKEIAIQTIEQDNADPLDLLAELDVQRIILAVMLDKFNAGMVGVDSGKGNGKPSVVEVVDDVEVVGDVDTGGGGGVVSFASDVTAVVDGHTEFSSSNVENPSDVLAWVMANAELVQQIRQELNDIVTTVTRIVAQRNQTAITKAEVAWLVMTLKEGMDKFVPKENQEAYIRWMMENIPGHKRVESAEMAENSE